MTAIKLISLIGFQRAELPQVIPVAVRNGGGDRVVVRRGCRDSGGVRRLIAPALSASDSHSASADGVSPISPRSRIIKGSQLQTL